MYQLLLAQFVLLRCSAKAPTEKETESNAQLNRLWSPNIYIYTYFFICKSWTLIYHSTFRTLENICYFIFHRCCFSLRFALVCFGLLCCDIIVCISSSVHLCWWCGFFVRSEHRFCMHRFLCPVHSLVEWKMVYIVIRNKTLTIVDLLTPIDNFCFFERKQLKLDFEINNDGGDDDDDESGQLDSIAMPSTEHIPNIAKRKKQNAILPKAICAQCNTPFDGTRERKKDRNKKQISHHFNWIRMHCAE